MAKLSAAQKTERGKELTPARLFAFKLWEKNPQITSAELGKALEERGFEVGKGTYITWLARYRKGGHIRTYDGKPLKAEKAIEARPPVEPSEVTPAVKTSKLTLEQIIKAVGSVEALSLLFYQGVMEELKRRDSAYDVLKQDCVEKDTLISGLKHSLEEVTKDRNAIVREYNEKIAKFKVGTLTLDQVEHRLIAKR
ncbi:hypothetical protein ES703_74425 [subsurface metagenome]